MVVSIYIPSHSFLFNKNHNLKLELKVKTKSNKNIGLLKSVVFSWQYLTSHVA